MVFILCTLKIYRNIPCLFTSKLIVTAYSASVKHAATGIAPKRKDQYTPKPLNFRSHGAVMNPVVVTHPDKIIENQEVPKREVVVGNSKEWQYMELDVTKLHKYCLMLSKIRLTSLVVMTTMAGYAVAPGPFDLYGFTMCSIGTGLVSATANAVNQFFEVPFDAQMSRTKNRVIVRGCVTPAQAATFAVICGVTGLTLLYNEVNGITALLGASNLILYTLIYTPMKRVSILNTWVGSIVGAIPPLMGWAACMGDIVAPGAWIMPGILYAWQFPHFNALSWNLRPDYSRAGYRMMAVTNPDLCRKTALKYTAALMVLCYTAPALDVTNWWFAITTTPLNLYFLYLAWQFNKQSDSASSRKLFRFSLVYLPALMTLLLLNKKYWFTKERSDTIEQRETLRHNDIFTSLTRFIMPSS